MTEHMIIKGVFTSYINLFLVLACNFCEDELCTKVCITLRTFCGHNLSWRRIAASSSIIGHRLHSKLLLLNQSMDECKNMILSSQQQGFASIILQQGFAPGSINYSTATNSYYPRSHDAMIETSRNNLVSASQIEN